MSSESPALENMRTTSTSLETRVINWPVCISIQIGKGEGSGCGGRAVAHVKGQPLGELRPADALSQCGDDADQRRGQHGHGAAPDGLHVVLFDALIDDHLEQSGTTNSMATGNTTVKKPMITTHL